MEQLLFGRAISGGSAKLLIDGRPYLNFAGNNYLALNDHPALRQAALDEVTTGKTFSMFLSTAYGAGEAAYLAVEEEACRYFGTEAAVYLPSGYFIGHAAMAGLRPLFDCIVIDEMAHWCMQDAAKLSERPTYRFRHDDATDLERVLTEKADGQRPLIVTDGSFATSGRLPRLDLYETLATESGGIVFVDESHSVGVIGERGRGAHEYFGCGPTVYFGATFSKAICGEGGIFVGSRGVVDRAVTSTVLRGSSKGSPISARISAAGMKVIRENPAMIRELAAKSKALRQGLRSLGLAIEDSPAPVFSFSLGSFAANRELQEALFARGIYVLHSNYIAAGPGGCIRVTTFSDHAMEDIDRLVNAVGEVV